MPKRRSNGEGCLRRRPDGRWEITIMQGFTEDGRRSRKTFYGKTQKEANEKAYVAKLSAIDKSINNAIIQQAKAMGYDLVLVKGAVLYGGDDITEAISKVVK